MTPVNSLTATPQSEEKHDSNNDDDERDTNEHEHLHVQGTHKEGKGNLRLKKGGLMELILAVIIAISLLTQ